MHAPSQSCGVRDRGLGAPPPSYGGTVFGAPCRLTDWPLPTNSVFRRRTLFQNERGKTLMGPHLFLGSGCLEPKTVYAVRGPPLPPRTRGSLFYLETGIASSFLNMGLDSKKGVRGRFRVRIPVWPLSEKKHNRSLRAFWDSVASSLSR